jgi:hypothetical protein
LFLLKLQKKSIAPYLHLFIIYTLPMPAPPPPPNLINKTSSMESSQMTFHGFSSFIHGIWTFNAKKKIVNEQMMDEINYR